MLQQALIAVVVFAVLSILILLLSRLGVRPPKGKRQTNWSWKWQAISGMALLLVAYIGYIAWDLRLGPLGSVGGVIAAGFFVTGVGYFVWREFQQSRYGFGQVGVDVVLVVPDPASVQVGEVLPRQLGQHERGDIQNLDSLFIHHSWEGHFFALPSLGEGGLEKFVALDRFLDDDTRDFLIKVAMDGAAEDWEKFVASDRFQDDDMRDLLIEAAMEATAEDLEQGVEDYLQDDDTRELSIKEAAAAWRVMLENMIQTYIYEFPGVGGVATYNKGTPTEMRALAFHGDGRILEAGQLVENKPARLTDLATTPYTRLFEDWPEWKGWSVLLQPVGRDADETLSRFRRLLRRHFRELRGVAEAGQ